MASFACLCALVLGPALWAAQDGEKEAESQTAALEQQSRSLEDVQDAASRAREIIARAASNLDNLQMLLPAVQTAKQVRQEALKAVDREEFDRVMERLQQALLAQEGDDTTMAQKVSSCRETTDAFLDTAALDDQGVLKRLTRVNLEMAQALSSSSPPGMQDITLTLALSRWLQTEAHEAFKCLAQLDEQLVPLMRRNTGKRMGIARDLFLSRSVAPALTPTENESQQPQQGK